MPYNVSTFSMRTRRPGAGVRSPIESVTERSLGSQHFLLHQALPRWSSPTPGPLCPHPGARSLPDARLLPTWSPVRRCPTQTFSPQKTLPKWWCQPPAGSPHSSSPRPLLTSLLLPAPPLQLWSWSPPLSPSHQHPSCPHLLIRPF